MALGGLFRRKKKDPPKRYSVVLDGKIKRYANPLAETFPVLYQQESKDNFARRDEILEDADTVARDLLYACHLPLKTVPGLIKGNFGLLLEIPLVYDLFVALKRQGFERYYENNLALQALLQSCAFYTTSDVGQKLREDLMLYLLAVCTRHYGVLFLKRADREVLKQERQYDVANARQKQLRDDFLKRYQAVADEMARLSVDRLHQVVDETKEISKEQYKSLMQVLRYSTRLMGRAAAQLKLGEREAVHATTSYVAMLYNFASAWISKRKRTPLILAEEWGRSRESFSKKESRGRAAQSIQALTDLFRLCRCQVIPNFQGSNRDAIYSITDRLIIKEVPIVAEMKEGKEDSVRRYVASLGEGSSDEASSGPGPRTASDIRSRLRAGEEEALSVNRSVIHLRWQCFRSSKSIEYRCRNLMEALEGKRRLTNDPEDSDLTPID